MRTYDKQIETIQTGQGNGSLRSSFGWVSAAVGLHVPTVAAPQDTV